MKQPGFHLLMELWLAGEQVGEITSCEKHHIHGIERLGAGLFFFFSFSAFSSSHYLFQFLLLHSVQSSMDQCITALGVLRHAE